MFSRYTFEKLQYIQYYNDVDAWLILYVKN